MKNVVTRFIALGALALFGCFGCEGKSETAKPAAKPEPATAAPAAAAPAASAGAAKPPSNGGW